MTDEKKDLLECGCEIEHDDDCGCGSVHEYECEEGELPTILLTFEGDDEEVECGILGLFDFEGRSYIALLVPSEDDEEEEEIYLYRYSEDKDEQPILEMIEDDEEYERVADEFERLDEEEFGEEFDEE